MPNRGADGAAAAAEPSPPTQQLQQAARISRDDAQAWFRPRLPHRFADLHCNYLVMGETGLGKTTFISNLVSSFQVERQAQVDGGGATLMEQFQADPDSLRTVLEPMDIPESSRRLIVAIQDMPGWGHDVNMRRYLRTVITFLLEQRERDYETLGPQQLPRGARGMPADTMSGQLQHSITACLYFLPPHRVKKIDLILMAAISQLVTIVPVISKSDTMTEAELATYRTQLTAMFEAPSKAIGPAADVSLQLFDIAPEVRQVLGIAALPMAVICSAVVEPCSDAGLLALVGPDGLSDPHQPVRAYGWGACYPYDRSHQSDLIALKRLLLGDQVESIYALAEDSYRRFVEFCTAYDEAAEQVGALVHDACHVGRLLEYDEYAKVYELLLEAKTAVRVLKAANADMRRQIAEAGGAKVRVQERGWRR